MRTMLLATALTACVGNTAVPTAMHPTATSGEQSVGVAVGGAYQKEGNSSLLTVPHGEGWIRAPSGTGQVGLNIGPGGLRASYRYDVTPMANGVGFVLEPMIGGAYYRQVRENTSSTGSTTTKTNIAMFTAGIVPTILIPSGSNFAYISGKLGIQLAKDFDTESSNDTQKSYVVGVSAGIGLGEHVSLELAVHRLDDLESGETTDTEPAWQIVPTVGVRH